MSARFVCLWLAACAGLALCSRAALRASVAGRCALDGAAIAPAARVDLLEQGAPRASFCSIECALAWPLEPSHEQRFVVHEERHGQPLDPEAAYFVRSDLRSQGARERLRAFADPLAAAEHARAFGGALVPNPFSEKLR